MRDHVKSFFSLEIRESQWGNQTYNVLGGDRLEGRGADSLNRGEGGGLTRLAIALKRKFGLCLLTVIY